MIFDIIKDKLVVTRQIAQCGYCSEQIPRNQIARYRFYKIDGDIGTDWMHPACYREMREHGLNMPEEPSQTGVSMNENR